MQFPHPRYAFNQEDLLVEFSENAKKTSDVGQGLWSMFKSSNGSWISIGATRAQRVGIVVGRGVIFKVGCEVIIPEGIPLASGTYGAKIDVPSKTLRIVFIFITICLYGTT
jgi:hypothetical protein